jgi:catechol 2,3-dioxygenase-like lactoylglutathione lyase family enzyme
MTDVRTPSAEAAPAPRTARILTVSPILLVADVVKAAEYYVDKLGFTVPRFWGDTPHFCIPRRGPCSVMLNQVGADPAYRPNAAFNERFDVYFEVDDADALHAEYEASGADIVCAPEDMPYLMREFQVRDIDGHLLAFGHDISGGAEAP